MIVVWRDVGFLLILGLAVGFFIWFIHRERASRMEAAWPGRPIGYMKGVILSDAGEAEFLEGVAVETPYADIPGFMKFWEDRLIGYLRGLSEPQRSAEKGRILSKLEEIKYHKAMIGRSSSSASGSTVAGLTVKCYGFSNPRMLLITYGYDLDDPKVQRTVATPYISRILGPLPTFFAAVYPAYMIGSLAEPTLLDRLLERVPLLREVPFPWRSVDIPVYLGFPLPWDDVKVLTLDGETRKRLYTLVEMASRYANAAEIERENSVLRDEYSALSKAYEELKASYGGALADRDRLLRLIREQGVGFSITDIFTRVALTTMVGLAAGWIILPKALHGDPGGGAFLGAIIGLAAGYLLVGRMGAVAAPAEV